MRTTLIIQDELMAEAKQLAARQGSSVSSLVNEALREKIKFSGQNSRNTPPFQKLTFGGSSESARATGSPAVVDLLPEAMAEMVAEDDLKTYRPE